MKQKKLSLNSLKAKCWKLVSEFVRKSAADWRGNSICYTCGACKPWQELQCGHYIHNKLDFDLRNLKPQCVRCNKYLSGNGAVYAEKLIKENGLKWIEKLRQDSVTKGNNYTIEELEKLVVHFKNQ